MRIGFQGEAHSYSDQATAELFPDEERVGYHSFVAVFDALESGTVDRLVLPIENSTTGSILPVLDRLVPSGSTIVGEHMVEVRHALLTVPGADVASIRTVRSHPQALLQAESLFEDRGWEAVPTHDTAGAVRQVAEMGDPTVAALAPRAAAAPHGLDVGMEDVMDRDHNTTRFVVLAHGASEVPDDATKTSIVFSTLHQPGALALALTEIGLRGANLTRIESRPSEEKWQYRQYVDLTHPPGLAGRGEIFEPPPTTLIDLHILGTYRPAD